MKTVDNGMFVLDAKGMHMRFDILPYEQIGFNQFKNSELLRTKANKENEGIEYLKLAIETVKNNLDKFQYAAKETPDHVTITNTKSIVGI